MTIRRAATVAAILSASLLGACAKAPESIQASYISPLKYQNLNCSQLAREGASLDGALQTAAAQQRKARNNDVAGVILIGLPVSSLSGDNIAPEIARLKGEREAVRQERVRKNCSGAA